MKRITLLLHEYTYVGTLSTPYGWRRPSMMALEGGHEAINPIPQLHTGPKKGSPTNPSPGVVTHHQAPLRAITHNQEGEQSTPSNQIPFETEFDVNDPIYLKAKFDIFEKKLVDMMVIEAQTKLVQDKEAGSKANSG